MTGIASLAVGESFVDISINPKDDGITEGNETVTLTLATGSDYDIDTSQTTATVAIADKFNPIDGGGSHDPLIGTAGNDRIVGGTGSKTITGGLGNDEFVYTSLTQVGHRITDFTVGSDQIVLTQLLDSLVSGGYNGSDAVADGYVRLVQGKTANSTILQIDRDGLAGDAIFRNFIQLDNVTPQAMNNINNFVF
ncbi:type I secretion C-terminal target domain-containing protein [Nostocaceae cyanobacterium CENA369]|uniref:Type I secretion C-terminal target domain-containing protein n=1 Tax=Dendronalium phyllosphericum CENA369 TaxID=1725256 RepID=A0A8J7LJV0_9NOST|nr:type I secretion C-terminal target domain-containing protein [Dendronalium phyllosphericum CENA369]